jgi:RNA polymerase sigma-70 factor (ECF subfamily)
MNAQPVIYFQAIPSAFAVKRIGLESTSAQSEHGQLDGLLALDPQAISAVYDRYFPMVFRFVRYRLGDETQAEDVTGDVFVRLLEAVRARRGPKSDVKAWLFGTASHAVNDVLRRAYRQPAGELSDDLVDALPLPPEAAEGRESSRALGRALARLTPDQQNVLALRFGQGLSLEETASLMKKKTNAVKQLQLRALAALQRAMAEAAYG